jgi:hypothetical protein
VLAPTPAVTPPMRHPTMDPIAAPGIAPMPPNAAPIAPPERRKMCRVLTDSTLHVVVTHKMQPARHTSRAGCIPSTKCALKPFGFFRRLLTLKQVYSVVVCDLTYYCANTVASGGTGKASCPARGNRSRCFRSSVAQRLFFLQILYDSASEPV